MFTLFVRDKTTRFRSEISDFKFNVFYDFMFDVSKKWFIILNELNTFEQISKSVSVEWEVIINFVTYLCAVKTFLNRQVGLHLKNLSSLNK